MKSTIAANQKRDNLEHPWRDRNRTMNHIPMPEIPIEDIIEQNPDTFGTLDCDDNIPSMFVEMGMRRIK